MASRLKEPLRQLFDRIPMSLETRYRLWGQWRVPSIDYYRPADVREPALRTLEAFTAGAGDAPVVWFTPTLHPMYSWYSAAFQRPQQLARALAEAGCRVVYHEPLDPQSLPDGIDYPVPVGTLQPEENLCLLRCHDQAFPKYMAACRADIAYYFEPEHARHLPPDFSGAAVFDVLDDPSIRGLDSDPAWVAEFNRCLETAHVVLVTADRLQEKIGALRKNVVLVPNGVRTEDWRVPNAPIPPDLEAARAAPVVVGYYGALARWYDWPLFTSAVAAKPEWAFVIIGFDAEGRGLAGWHERFAAHPNVHFLGKKPYTELPGYAAHFDVGTIPFVLNDITHACSPVKLFEFMASGTPVVATRMHEIEKYTSVVFTDGTDYTARLEDAVAKSHDPAYRAALDREADANTWRARAEAIVRAVEAAAP